MEEARLKDSADNGFMVMREKTVQSKKKKKKDITDK